MPKKRKAWVVTASDYDINEIWGVYTTKKKAEQALTEMQEEAKFQYLHLNVEPYILNENQY